MLNRDTSFLCLYADCVPVRGHKRSTVCDLQTNKFYFIPNILFEMLTEHSNKTIQEVVAFYGEENRSSIEEYTSFLLDNNLAFLTLEPEKFSRLDLKWDTPSQVTNAIVDIDAGSAHPYTRIISELDDMNCKCLEIRTFTKGNYQKILQLLACTQESRLRAISILLPFSEEEFTEKDLEVLCEENKRIRQVLVHGSPQEYMDTSITIKATIVYSSEKIDSSAHCGIIHPSHFKSNIYLFSESHHHNSCLNRKISIDVNGDIKNCPSMSASFGNIAVNTLGSVVEQDAFRVNWNITKDQVDVCRSCEFRYICTDCRAFTENGNPYGKPAKCSYDPFTATWADEEDNPKGQQFRKIGKDKIKYFV
ncbi:MAG: grasp-with-spasm system SPASM domain peptide maturase [Chitinophagaceae bacterium]|nr:grasp-with-spasm system SPASM domain peptide maturase [Chitinophagaceae bacterium]